MSMKVFANPILLLIVMALLTWKIIGTEVAEDNPLLQPDIWVLCLCVTGCVVNGALSIAKALTHRAPLMGVVWSVMFLVLGCCAWVVVTHGDAASRADERAYAAMKEAWHSQQAEPYAVNDEGQSLITLAAALGKTNDLKKLLQLPLPENQKVTAAFRAAEQGKKDALALLIQTGGVSPNAAAEESTLLCTAVCQGRKETAKALLLMGANVNLADAEGLTPLMHAVIGEDVVAVRLLLDSGANVSATTPDGRDAASYSNAENISSLLAQ